MAPRLEEILQSALALPPDQRAALAETLFESLEESDRAEVDAAWAKEAEDRLRAFDEEKIKAIPGDEVMRSIRQGKVP
jgi:putative addiction module component (TIGR02574 family)